MPASPLPESRAIVLLALAGFSSTASFRVCDPMLPQLAQTFGVTTGSAAAVITAFAVAYGVLQLFYGPLGDHYGKLRVASYATLACTVGNLGGALSESLGTLVLWRTITGATAAGIVPLSMAWIGDAIPYDRRQATIARFLTGTILGLAAGQMIGGLFADTLGWRGAFVVLALINLLAGGWLATSLRRAGESPAAATSEATTPASGFGWRARAIIGDGWARTIVTVAFVEGALMFGALSFVPAYLHERFAISLTAAGAIAAAFSAGGIGYTLMARSLVARLRERGLVTWGGAVIAVAFGGLVAAPTWHWTLPASVLSGFGFYMVHSTLQTHATQMAPKARGTAVALFAATLFLGQSVGVSLAGTMVDHVGAAWMFVAVAVAMPGLAGMFAWALARRSAGPPGPA